MNVTFTHYPPARHASERPAPTQVVGTTYFSIHDTGIEGEIVWFADGFQRVEMAGDTEAGDFQILNLNDPRILMPKAPETAAKQKLQIVCKCCGSEDVMRDAWAEWDVDAQAWVLKSVFDAAYCESCDGEARLMEVPVDRP